MRQMTSFSPSQEAQIKARLARAILKDRGYEEQVTFEPLRDWVERVAPHYEWYEHCIRLAAVLQRVVRGELKRVMIFAPPRHGKSELVSRLLPGYYLTCHPRRWVGMCGYGSDLTKELAREARMHYTASGGVMRKDQRAAANWRTAAGGGLWAAGVGGPMTGRGAHLLLLDDPIKNADEAASPVYRRRQQDWWQSTFTTRAEPGAAIVVIQTRWHKDDLAGWLLKREEENEPEGWHIVHMPAIAEPPPPFPAGCTVEPEWRRDGQALCPERYDLADLAQQQVGRGPYYWAAMYQQRPSPRGGGMFLREWLPVEPHLPQAPEGQPPLSWRWIRYWDKAATAGGEGARTAGVLIGKAEQRYLIASVVAGRWSAVEREKVILETAINDRAVYGHVATWVEQEPGSGGKESAENTVRGLVAHGFAAHAEPVRGEKTLRAEPLAAAAAAGSVALLAGPWVEAFWAEAELFPMGALKDQVDAASGAYNRLAAPGDAYSVPSPW